METRDVGIRDMEIRETPEQIIRAALASVDSPILGLPVLPPAANVWGLRGQHVREVVPRDGLAAYAVALDRAFRERVGADLARCVVAPFACVESARGVTVDWSYVTVDWSYFWEPSEALPARAPETSARAPEASARSSPLSRLGRRLLGRPPSRR